jgi:hypothetical protein
MAPLAATVVVASQLDTMFVRGDSAIAIEWTPDSVNTRGDWYVQYGSTCAGADSVYRHCDFQPGVTYKSIAYSYGGEDGYIRFRDKIKEGYLVGSHMCHYNNYGDPSKVIAGTDCSGFVCYLWGVPRVSTRELSSQYKAIMRDELDAGDILVKSGSHTVLIVEREDSTHLLIWESTSAVNGCRERSIDLTDTYWDAYVPRRFEGLTADVLPVARSPRHRPLPRVSWVNNHVIVHSSGPWQGTVELFSLHGRRIASVECGRGNSNNATASFTGSDGIAIIRVRSADGTVVTTPLSALHR